MIAGLFHLQSPKNDAVLKITSAQMNSILNEILLLFSAADKREPLRAFDPGAGAISKVSADFPVTARRTTIYERELADAAVRARDRYHHPRGATALFQHWRFCRV
jgi:hypothetical protein